MTDKYPFLDIRWRGRQYSYVTGSLAAQNAFDTMIWGKVGTLDKLVSHYTWGDQKAIWQIYKAAERMAAETGGNMDDIFTRAMETQPNWGAMHRSMLTSSPNVFLRGSTMFMSARQAQYNILLRAKSDLAAGRITKAQFAERTGGVVYANALVAVAKRLTKLGVKGAAGSYWSSAMPGTVTVPAPKVDEVEYCSV